MILDTLTSAEKYYSLHKNFQAAFEYLNTNDLSKLAVGVFTIADGLTVTVAEGDGRTAEAALQGFECHNKNIDIQVCIRGDETMYWKPRQDCKAPKGEYSNEKDLLFYADAPDTHFALKSRQFVIFFPTDVHAAMIGEGVIKKLVVKVRID